MTEKREKYQVRPTDEIFRQLTEPIPEEALSTDEGRGFPLTSIKAAYILERLNQVFGLLGYGWRYAVGPHRLETAGGKEEILVEVALQWRLIDAIDQGDGYCYPVYWGRHLTSDGTIVHEGWHFQTRPLPRVWSEPIFATGGSAANRKGGVPLTDAYRSAVTNAITKAAGRMGVGIEVWKGQTDAPPGKASTKGKRRTRHKPAAKPKAGTKGSNSANGGFATLTAMMEAAQAELSKLNGVPGDQEAEAATLQNLARLMKKAKLEMQPTRLLRVLLGEGPVSQRRVMAVCNFLSSKSLSAENIAMLNTAAWEEPWEDTKASD